MVRYETALVFDVSRAVHAAVARLRERSVLSGHASWQARPHLTILFVGFPDRETLERLERALRGPPFATLEVPLSGFGCFETQGVITNLHIAVEPVPELLAVHEWARSRCESVGWQPPPEYVGSHYLPHITVFGEIEAPLGTMKAFSGRKIPSRARLGGLDLRAHPVKTSR